MGVSWISGEQSFEHPPDCRIADCRHPLGFRMTLSCQRVLLGLTCKCTPSANFCIVWFKAAALYQMIWIQRGPSVGASQQL